MDKKYEGMRKIYKLSDTHPAQMMINGNMEFENIPLETIIQEFIKNTKFKRLKTVEEIKNEFIDFIARYCPTSSVDDYIEFIVERFKDELETEIAETGFENIIENRRKRNIYPFILKCKNTTTSLKSWMNWCDKIGSPSLNISENIYTGWNFNPCCDGILSFEISSLVTNLGSCMRKMSNGTIVSIVSGLDKE